MLSKALQECAEDHDQRAAHDGRSPAVLLVVPWRNRNSKNGAELVARRDEAENTGLNIRLVGLWVYVTIAEICVVSVNWYFVCQTQRPEVCKPPKPCGTAQYDRVNHPASLGSTIASQRCASQTQSNVCHPCSSESPTEKARRLLEVLRMPVTVHNGPPSCGCRSFGKGAWHL
jgi:hypothetical protein